MPEMDGNYRHEGDPQTAEWSKPPIIAPVISGGEKGAIRNSACGRCQRPPSSSQTTSNTEVVAFPHPCLMP